MSETNFGESEEPRSAAVTFITTEHFALQGARSSTVAESTGRATMFIGAVSGSLVALGLIATATQVGAEFYAFALVLLPTLTFIGLVTYERVLQSGIEDLMYARRIARIRDFYFAIAPELTPYLLSAVPERRLNLQGLFPSVSPKASNVRGLTQGFRTVAGMVGVLTAVLAGSAVGLPAGILAGYSLTVGFSVGAAIGIGALYVLMRYQWLAWTRALSLVFFAEADERSA